MAQALDRPLTREEKRQLSEATALLDEVRRDLVDVSRRLEVLEKRVGIKAAGA